MSLLFKRSQTPSTSNPFYNVGILNDELAICPDGYINFYDLPEIKIATDRISTLVSIMTIQLMKNTEQGDERVYNGLSRKLDVTPYSLGTRQTLIYSIVNTMLTSGEGNAVVFPVTENGYLSDLIPIPPNYYKWVLDDTKRGYKIQMLRPYQGIQAKTYNSDRFLHFVNNPDPARPYMGTGYKISLKEISDNLRQAQATKKAFMSDKWKPSLIISVDALNGDFGTEEGRNKILDRYVGETKGGRPWVIPAGLFEIEQIKPLSLKDLAIHETMVLDKETVAAMFGIPKFILGIGKFDQDEYNNFIDTVILKIAKALEQELTKKIIVDTNHYIKFNAKSLYAYNIQETAKLYSNLYTKGLLTGNEVRDNTGHNPMPELEKLTILENYIPLEDIGNQKKLDKE